MYEYVVKSKPSMSNTSTKFRTFPICRISINLLSYNCQQSNVNCHVCTEKQVRKKAKREYIYIYMCLYMCLSGIHIELFEYL